MEEIVNELEGAAQAPSFILRKLQVTDIGKVCKIISKIGLDDVAQVFNKKNAMELVASIADNKNAEMTDETKEKLIEQVGVGMTAKMIETILANVENFQEDIISFFADLSNKEFDEVNNNPSMFIEMVYEFFNKPELVGFIKTASLLNSKLDMKRL